VATLAADAIEYLALTPPIDLAIVASYFGIGRISVEDLSWAGCLLVIDGVPEIRLRASDGEARRRFSGFHEVTHTFMPGFRLVPQYRCDPGPFAPTRDEVETLCDSGASEFLLPRAFFRDDLLAGSFGLELVEDLAGAYEASLEATAHRLVNFWPEDVAFFSLELRNKPRDIHGAEPRIRVNSMRGTGLIPWVPKHKSIDLGSIEETIGGAIIDEHLSDVRLGGRNLGPCHLVAKPYPFTDQEGNMRNRVLALLRRTSVAS
jgi:hypothetical protein